MSGRDANNCALISAALTLQIDAQVPYAAVERDEVERRRRPPRALLDVPATTQAPGVRTRRR